MKGWELKPLGEVCAIKPPKSEASAKLAGSDEVSFAPMEDLGIGVKHLQPSRIRRLEEVGGSYTYFADGDVLLAKITPCFENGKLGIARNLKNGIGFGSSEYIVLRPGPSLVAEFLYYYLARPVFLEEGARSMTGAVGHKRVAKEFVERYPIPIPPLDEQRRIVALLDEAFEGIATTKANAEKNLQNARELLAVGYRSIVDAFDQSSWGQEAVANLAAAAKGSMRTGPFGSQLLHSEFVGDGIAVLGIDNAVANEFRWDKRRYITEEKYRDLARYRVHPGDVLITIMGTCGRCAVVPDDIPLAINSKHLCCISLNREKCLPEYLHLYFLRDPTARSYLEAQAKGSIMAGLNMGIISALPVRLPSIDEQRRIVERFDELKTGCDRLAEIQQQKLRALGDLKGALLSQAFTGQLTRPRLKLVATSRAVATSSPDFSAAVIALAYAKHLQRGCERTFGHVKVQKLLHLVEALCKLDLGRRPMRHAAGPHDGAHMRAVEDRAKQNKHFEMVERDEGGYTFVPLPAFDNLVADAPALLGSHLKKVEAVIDLLIPMNTLEAEVFATVYAAWNNLLFDKLPVSEEIIFAAAREGWHPNKLRIDEHEFPKALAKIRAEGLQPDGTAKYVGGQQSLPLQ